MRTINKILVSIIYICFCSNTFADNNDKPTLIPPYRVASYNQVIKNIYTTIAASHSQQMLERLDAVSAFFLGKPYVLGNLGEGPQAPFDQQPLYRTDVFDCQTYVTTVLALVEANNFDDFTHHFLQVAYKEGVPTFLNRNHFVSVDWNMNNEKNGYLKDITIELFPHDYSIATALIDKPSWYQHFTASHLQLLKLPTATQTQLLLNALHDLSKQTQAVTNHLAYVPLTLLFNRQGEPNQDLFNRIPSGTVIEIVRPNWNVRRQIGTNMNVSHLGFGIRKNGILYYREASSIQNKVIDTPLADYLRAYLNSSSVKGIHIEEIKLK